MPISRSARSTRTAISPRLAIRTLRIRRLGGLALMTGPRSYPGRRRGGTGVGGPENLASRRPACLASFSAPASGPRPRSDLPARVFAAGRVPWAADPISRFADAQVATDLSRQELVDLAVPRHR